MNIRFDCIHIFWTYWPKTSIFKISILISYYFVWKKERSKIKCTWTVERLFSFTWLFLLSVFYPLSLSYSPSSLPQSTSLYKFLSLSFQVSIRLCIASHYVSNPKAHSRTSEDNTRCCFIAEDFVLTILMVANAGIIAI